MIILQEMGMPRILCAPLDKLLIKLNPVMESVLLTTSSRQMLMATPPVNTIQVALVKAATSAGTSVLGRTGTVPVEMSS